MFSIKDLFIKILKDWLLFNLQYINVHILRNDLTVMSVLLSYYFVDLTTC